MAFVADQLADRARAAAWAMTSFSEIQQAVRNAAIAHFVIQTGHDDIVANTRLAVWVHGVLWDDEKGYAADSGTQETMLIRHLSEHEVDNVVREVVIAPRDPHLVAGQSISPIGLTLCARRDIGQCGSRVRLGE